MQYDPSRILFKPILSEDDKINLKDLASRYPLAKFKKDIRNYEEAQIDFVYTSAKIEGNTYTRADTDTLIKHGRTAGGKSWHDAMMILNIREAFDIAMNASPEQTIDIDFISDLHKILMTKLLPSNEQGLVRNKAVQIGGSDYKPLSDPYRLRTEMKVLVSNAEKYTDPFEKAIYLHCNLAYLQYFADGNKRTARMMQTCALAQADTLPMFFKDYMIDEYVNATVHYYETGDYNKYVNHFKEVYKISVIEFSGESLEAGDQDKLRFTKLTKLLMLKSQDNENKEVISSLRDFYTSESNNGAYKPNWMDINRMTYIRHVIEKGENPEGVINIIIKHSPGIISDQEAEGFKDDARIISRKPLGKKRDPDDEFSL